MAGIKTSLVCTILNEEKTIGRFIDSVANQKLIPQEIVIVDGGSKDKTLDKIKEKIIRYPFLKIKLLKKIGNRSVGRNEAIRKSKNEIILSADAGCILDKNWTKEITKLFYDKNIDVVAGYYKGLTKTSFQQSLVPYVLVMEDKADPKNFLPATRSMAFKKSVWKKIGGFDKRLSHNEDYAFANKLRKINAKIVFTKKAIVYWIPRKNIWQSFTMFFRFALGDAESGILRNKVLLIFSRYIIFFYSFFLIYVYKSLILFWSVIFGAFGYILWSIFKNSKYVESSKKIVFFPLLQFTSDLAVLSGTVLGLLIKAFNFPVRKTIFKNWKLFVIFLIYIITVMSSITWGIPDNNHPFLYHMDEWHQLQSVRHVFKEGSPNLSGAANGTIFHFFYSGILLIPFIISQIVNPLAIKSAIDNIPQQHILFIILRLNTLFFGVLTLFFVNKVSKLLRINSLIATTLFAFTPLWLMLSNNFKYDIALTFWLVLSFYSFLIYSRKPTTRNFIFAAVISALSLSVKVSALPIVPIFILSFFLFTQDLLKNLKRLILGSIVFFITLALFGSPDLIFGGFSITNYIHDNLISIPNMSNNINLGYSYFSYVFLYHFPTIFGHTFFGFFVLFVVYFIKIIYSDFLKKRKQDFLLDIFILISFLLFLVSLIPLKFFIVGNRALPLLIYMVVIFGIGLSRISKNASINKKKLVYLAAAFVILIQIAESYLWVGLKLSHPPQETSSIWVQKNIERGKTIGIENIPLYQFEPNIVLKEFYEKQYNLDIKNKYNYEIINAKTKNKPSFIIISNVFLSLQAEKNSFKKELIKNLQKEGYKIVYQAKPMWNFYKYFGNEFNFIYSGLIAYPTDISVFKK